MRRFISSLLREPGSVPSCWAVLEGRVGGPSTPLTRPQPVAICKGNTFPYFNSRVSCTLWYQQGRDHTGIYRIAEEGVLITCECRFLIQLTSINCSQIFFEKNKRSPFKYHHFYISSSIHTILLSYVKFIWCSTTLVI